MPDTEKKIFYGWYIVAMAFVANFMSTGTSFYLFNAILQPLCQTHGWTRTQVNLAMVMSTFFVYLSQAVYGTVVMRTGPRLLMLCGPLVAGAACIMVGRVSSLPLFYLFFLILYLGSGSYGGVTANTAVSNWFMLKRGRALGLATTATSLSGAVVPFAAMLLIEGIGLRGTFLWTGLAIMAVSPVAWCVVRNWPEEHGLTADGLSSPDHGPRPVKPDHAQDSHPPLAGGDKDKQSWAPAKLARTAAFWKLGFAYGMTSIGVVGVMSQLKPRFCDYGFSGLTAMAMMAATALCGAVGKYAWGSLCDRYKPRNVATGVLAANALGLALALWHGNMAAVVLFIVVFGFAMGGVMSTYPIIIAAYFGRKAFASVLRFAALFLILEMAGFLIAGQSYDRTGSYDAAYTLFFIFDLVAVLLIRSIKPPANTEG